MSPGQRQRASVPDGHRVDAGGCGDYEHNPELGEDLKSRTIALAITTALLAGAVIVVAAFFFGAGLRCND
jgi:hypothetical protein